MIQFLVNNELIEIDDEPADLTLLDFLRERKGLSGTKEGCAFTILTAEESSSLYLCEECEVHM